MAYQAPDYVIHLATQGISFLDPALPLHPITHRRRAMREAPPADANRTTIMKATTTTTPALSSAGKSSLNRSATEGEEPQEAPTPGPRTASRRTKAPSEDSQTPLIQQNTAMALQAWTALHLDPYRGYERITYAEMRRRDDLDARGPPARREVAEAWKRAYGKGMEKKKNNSKIQARAFFKKGGVMKSGNQKNSALSRKQRQGEVAQLED